MFFLVAYVGSSISVFFFGPRDAIPFPWHRFPRFRDPGGLGHTTFLDSRMGWVLYCLYFLASWNYCFVGIPPFETGANIRI